MTIIEKWRLMMSSFADIRDAIIEKGGTLPDNKGYNRYANAVRSIYSDVYTDEYLYPERLTILISNAINLVRWCKAIKEQIRQAIIGGGVECDESVPLSQYGDKIREIDIQLQILTPDVLPDGHYRKPYECQLEAVGGTPPYTWDFTNGENNNMFKGAGLEMTADGHISGICSQNGGRTFSYYVLRVTDADGNIATKEVKWTIRPATIRIYFNQYAKYTGESITPVVTELTSDVDISDFEFEILLDGQPTQTEVGQYSVEIKTLPKFYSSQWNAIAYRSTFYIVTPEEYEEKGYGT